MEATMGVWGAGLYSGDFAKDLRSTVSAVARLPFGSEKLVHILCETEPRAANNSDDEEHTIFWLVVADQFAKRSISCDRTRDNALTIIKAGSDLAMHEKLGMNPSDLAKRRKILDDLRVRLLAPPRTCRQRSVLKRPQPFLFGVGDVFVYPTCGGACINPYAVSKERSRDGAGRLGWNQDSWSAMIIVDRGRAFGFLTWYRPLTISTATTHKPTIATLRLDLLWKLEQAGTCSAVHFKRMELEKVGTLTIDKEKLKRSFPHVRPGTYQAINNISLANALSVGPSIPAILMRKHSTILGLEQVLSD
jgi:hypothetical protein